MGYEIKPFSYQHTVICDHCGAVVDFVFDGGTEAPTFLSYLYRTGWSKLDHERLSKVNTEPGSRVYSIWLCPKCTVDFDTWCRGET